MRCSEYIVSQFCLSPRELVFTGNNQHFLLRLLPDHHEEEVRHLIKMILCIYLSLTVMVYLALLTVNIYRSRAQDNAYFMVFSLCAREKMNNVRQP